MITNDIVNQVAHLIRTRDLNLKDPKEIKVRKDPTAPVDEVEISSTGESYANPVSSESDYEKDQHMKVERLKVLIQRGNYKMDEDMVNNIAESIAKTLLT